MKWFSTEVRLLAVRASLLGVAWSSMYWLPRVGSLLGYELQTEPTVPYVGNMGTINDVRACVRSLLPAPLYVCCLGAFAVLLVETVKVLQYFLPARDRLSVHVALSFLQLVIVVDYLRVATPDWFVWSLSILGLSRLSEDGQSFEHRFLWPSAIMTCVAIAALIAQYRSSGVRSKHELAV